jgi:curli biogenesis system outer membrane secretion channel CsgG
MNRNRLLAPGLLLILAAGCATTAPKTEQVEAPATKRQQEWAQAAAAAPMAKRYKRKIAITRFTNETNYGRSLMTDEDYDRLGKQVSDMLASRLVKSGNFMVFERSDAAKLQREQAVSGGKMVGVDTVIVGSLTEFGRSIGGKTGFLSSTKNQVARAKVDIRLVDISTGRAFFSATGAGEANTESGEIAGYGSHAEYDATLNDRAIAAAITDVIDKLVSTLEEKPWRTDVLDVQGGQVFISGGQRQGLRMGDNLRVMSPGKRITSKQTGMDVQLPGTPIATIRVRSFFGTTDSDEGSICEILSGTVDAASAGNFYVEEVRP